MGTIDESLASQEENAAREREATAPHFDINASIVFQLGESLITDELQALLELIKNSYDAGADSVDIVISSRSSPDDSSFSSAQGFISISDNGIGMNDSDLIRGWLTISGSPKREVKRRHTGPKDLPKGRYPLGDKGLGRLGVQRLGNNLEISTRPAAGRLGSDVEYHMSFSWDAFRKVERLSQVVVPIKKVPAIRKPGTLIVVSELKDPKVWEGTKVVGSLQGRLAQLFSPFVPVPEFSVTLRLNGSTLDLLSAEREVLSAAQVEYRLDFDGSVLKIVGMARLGFLRPDKDEDRDLFSNTVESDDGRGFISFLQTLKEAPEYTVRRSDKEGWFVDFRKDFALETLDGVELIEPEPEKEKQDNAKTANPGPFSGQVYYFDLRKPEARPASYANRAKDFSTYVRQLSGVRVYRDGFGVRVDRDWLKMSEAFTSGSSYYSLRPANTVGYVAISSRENSVLEETTDREGFVDNAYYRNFYLLLSEFVQFSNGAQEFLRRGWLEFRKEHTKQLAGPAGNSSPEARAGHVVTSLQGVANGAGRLRMLNQRLGTQIAEAERTLSEVTETPGRNTLGDAERLASVLAQRIESLRDVLGAARQALSEAEQLFVSVQQIQAQAELVKHDLLAIQSRLADLHDMVSLGLTAEALSHELSNVLLQLSERVRTFSQYLKRARIPDSQTIAFSHFVGTSVSALRKQLTHLAPSLRYVREKREAIDLSTACRDLIGYYSGRFERYEGAIEVSLDVAEDFVIWMNRGKLNQIIDNLVLNSEYWLAEELRTKRLDQGEITLRLSRPFLRISDNGRGIDPALERSLFEPFVTGKASGVGRGLGLFIVEQLLEAEGCRIRLDPERNRHGRLHIFEIDFTAALHDPNG